MTEKDGLKIEEDKIEIGEFQLDTLNWVKTIKSPRHLMQFEWTDIAHCAKMKVNEKKLSKCQFHFLRLLVAFPKLKKSKKNFCPDGQLR